MASDAQFVAFICQQLAGAGDISARKMFGEFAIYCGDKVVALVTDNQLFVKPTVAGKALLGQPVLGAPFPGAKPYFLMADVDDPEVLSALIIATAQDLPMPKAKAARKVARKSAKQRAKKRAAKPK
jgi:TfoX/Sxy family transcriptional regulator of competence genes